MSMLMSPHLGYAHRKHHGFLYDIADVLKTKTSLERSLDWFQGRDRSGNMPSVEQLALDMMPNVLNDVFADFVPMCDKILVPEDELQ